MKASELRSGNLILETNQWDYDENCPFPDRIIEVKEYDCPLRYKSDDYTAIPLTEEWLLKFGFFKDNRQGYRLDDMYSLSFSVTKDGEFYPCWLDRLLPKVSVKYVHQLQNLYFALTGEELTLKA